MRFEHPHVLWLLLLVVPLLTGFLIWAWHVKRQLILQFVQSRLLASLTIGVSPARQRFRLVLLVLAAVTLFLALARPQWGFDYEEARSRGLDIVVAIDTSRSMLAEDVAPNRLTRAKLAALDLKKLARNDRMGLVAFAGSAFLQCPLSLDEEAFRQSVEALDVAIIPQGGTALAEAISTAKTAFKDKNDNHKILILFTDGEDHDGEAVAVAREAAKEGMRIFTIGVGTRNGELLRITDAQGRTEFVKDDQGQVVKSRLNEQLLQQVAQGTGGFYTLLTGANTMDLLYERALAPLPKAEFSSRRLKRYHERFQWVLALATILLVIEMLLPDRKKVRRPDPTHVAGRDASRVVALALLLVIPSAAFGGPIGRAWKNYQAGQYEGARLDYERALKDRPNDARLSFNAGAAAFQAGNFEEAEKHLLSAVQGQDVALQQKAYYNLGNAQFRLGERAAEPEAKQSSWEESMRSYNGALKLNPKDPDARYNLDFVTKKLEELKKEQEKKDQKKDDQDQDKDKDKKDENKDQQKKDQQKKDQEKKAQEKKEQQKKEQENKEQKDQGKKDENSKPDDPSSQKDKEGPEQKPKEAEPKDQGKDGQGQKKDKTEKPEDQSEAGEKMGVIQMTMEQALQLFDTQKSEERPLLFRPPPRPPKNQNRTFKDW